MPSRAQRERNVLLAVSGQTAPIVTETLWALERLHGVEIDEIRVITTAQGRMVLEHVLLGDSGKFAEYCRDYQIPRGRIAFSPKSIHVIADEHGTELADIRNSDDNIRAADRVFSLVREWTGREEESLYCSVAGGRKTLGIYLAMALMLCGRSQDKLYHVLVSTEFETGVPDFFYPPPAVRTYRKFSKTDESNPPGRIGISSEDANIELAEIPFLRLRALIGGELPLEKGLLGAIEHSQLLLAYLQSPPVLTVDLYRSSVEVGHFSFALPRQLLAVYGFLLYATSGSPSGLALGALFEKRWMIADLERCIDAYKAGEQEAYAWERMREPADFKDRIRSCVSKINKAIYSSVGRNRFAEQLKIHTGRSLRVTAANFRIVEQGERPWAFRE